MELLITEVFYPTELFTMVQDTISRMNRSPIIGPA